MNFIKAIRHYLIKNNNQKFTAYLRKNGVQVGVGCKFRDARIDITRPSLVTIGNNVRMNRGFTLLTHDFSTSVFRIKYGDFINSSGKVCIGDNVYFGENCTVLKGVTIGDNCIIGYGSVVTHDIPSNSVAVGSPAKVICSLDEYYEKRKAKALDEAFEYARSIVERFNRMPTVADFKEEFPYFVNGDEVDDFPDINIVAQLGLAQKHWSKNHKKQFADFDSFLKAAGINSDES